MKPITDWNHPEFIEYARHFFFEHEEKSSGLGNAIYYTALAVMVSYISHNGWSVLDVFMASIFVNHVTIVVMYQFHKAKNPNPDELAMAGELKKYG